MELTVIRKYFKTTYTIGDLYVDGQWVCNTLEDRVRDLQDRNHDGDYDDSDEGKVYGKTAIPCGRYRVLFTYSMKMQRATPILQDVPGFTGIRIHGGKNETWTEGCILVGENKVQGGLTNYKYWETKVGQMVREAINKKDKVYVTVKE